MTRRITVNRGAPVARAVRPLLLCIIVVSAARGQDSIKVALDTVVIIGENRSLLNERGRVFMGGAVSEPGALHDPVRMISSASSAVIVSDFQSLPTLGGDEPDRILVLMDGFPLVIPFRFLGGFSLFNSLRTQSIEYTSTGYSATYGNGFASAVQLASERNHADEITVKAEETPLLSNLATSIPLAHGYDATLDVAFRLSHTEGITPFVSREMRDQIQSFLPSMKDVQWQFSMAPSPSWVLEQCGILSDENGSLKNIDRGFSYRWQKVFLGSHIVHMAGNATLDGHFSWSHDNLALSAVLPVSDVGGLQFSSANRFDVLRAHLVLSSPVGKTADLAIGGEADVLTSTSIFDSFSSWLQERSPAKSSAGTVSLFGELQATWGRWLHVVAGLRGSFFGFTKSAALEPRLRLSGDLTTHMTVSIAAGEYALPPSNIEFLYGFLSLLALPAQPPRLLLMSERADQLVPERSTCLSARIRQDIGGSGVWCGTITVDGYLKWDRDVIMSARYPSVFSPLDSRSFDPSQNFGARKRGAGLTFLVLSPDSVLSVSASFGAQRSQVIDATTGLVYPAAADVLRSMKLNGRVEFSGWAFTAQFQYFTGAPTTDQYYLEGTSIFGGSFTFPVWSELNSGRLPDYKRLDLSVRKTILLGTWRIVPFVDILNVLNTKNITQFEYTYSATASRNVTFVPVGNSLPFLPTLGLFLSFNY